MTKARSPRGLRRQRHAAAIVAAAAILLVAGAARAFELERAGGNPCDAASRFVSWPLRSTAFSVESLGDVTAPIVREEAQAWNDSTSFTFFEEPERAVCDAADGVVSVSISDTLCDGSLFGQDVLAITLYRFNRASGEMLSAEIVFNAAEDLLSEADTFRHVALHELGHVLGLAHSDACGGSGDNSVMRAVLRRTDARLRVPGSDDVAGAEFVYGDPTATPTPTPTSPPTETPATQPPPGGGGGGGCATGGGAGAWWAWPLAGVALVALARRRRQLR